MRSSDIVCRIGGDEFLVICPKSDYGGALEIGKKILALSQPFFAENGAECWNGAVSVGVAEAAEYMLRSEALLKAADEALYLAKKRGGARVTGNREADAVS